MWLESLTIPTLFICFNVIFCLVLFFIGMVYPVQQLHVTGYCRVLDKDHPSKKAADKYQSQQDEMTTEAPELDLPMQGLKWAVKSDFYTVTFCSAHFWQLEWMLCLGFVMLVVLYKRWSCAQKYFILFCYTVCTLLWKFIWLSPEKTNYTCAVLPTGPDMDFYRILPCYGIISL